MKPHLVYALVVALALMLPVRSMRADEGRKSSPEEEALIGRAEVFVEAFEQGDAKALAALWAPDGEYRAQSREPLKGRPAIEAAFQQYFAANKGAKLRIDIDSVRFLTPDAREYFRLYAAQFEGRRVDSFWLGDNRVRVSSEDAMEFLYKYTWGPESFPYEIREQYGVRPYDEYRSLILEWLADEEHPPRAIPLPAAIASYLQPGYEKGLAGKVELYDENGRPVGLPDSNCLIVIEKT